ncbi:acetylxylan esterase [Phragmitibacter flavus]|uniref:Acetylxylan esterase n=1 Tax=Phragmitibacter flavus TaxID=2576071 RepID=A0A5R8K748_9BACT|nr:acetylxylan esterase [Phragmitibacter flavus]TLD68197.1 acetylxylan esterase [Phragmitibacter flavus]
MRLSAFIFLFAIGILNLNAETTTTAPAVTLKATTDRPDSIYKTGEPATFTISSSPAIDGPVTCILSKDGIQAQPPQTLNLQKGKATLTGTLDEPGFLQLRVTSPHAKSHTLAAAALDPHLIKPSMPVPDDFDTFWQNQKDALAKIPLKSTLTPVPATSSAPFKNIDAFDVQVDCLGAPVSGYFGKPKNAKSKSLPAILFVHGAGVRSANLGTVHWATNEGGMLTLDINAHGIPNGQPEEYYEQLSKNELLNYRAEGRADREKNYFTGMFLRVIRAIDFLTAQPEWDGKTLIVYGTSQGGYQAFAAAGLDSRVSFFCAGVPAGCDHSGSQADRVNGWPKMVPNDPATGKPDPLALQTSRYLDAVNFAQRAHGKGAAITVGFIDVTCPPTSVYAAYNALTIPKTLNTEPLAGHTNTPAALKFMQDAALQHVRDMKRISP